MPEKKSHTGNEEVPTLPLAPGAEAPVELEEAPPIPIIAAGEGSVYQTSRWAGYTKYMCPTCGFDTLNGKAMDDYARGCLREDCPYAGRKQELNRNV